MKLASESSPAPARSTLCFWLGYLFGGIAGLGLGALMGDIVGWVYMCGTVGCIASLGFDRPARSAVPEAAPSLELAPQLKMGNLR